MRKIFFILSLVFFAIPLFASEPLSFKKALQKYHRQGQNFNPSTFHDNISWHVIYKSSEFREAVAYKYAKDYRLSEEELKSRLWDEAQETAKGPEFILIVYTYSKSWNDLDSKESVWKLRLEGNNKQFDPLSITSFKPTPLETSMYPYMDPWTKAYSAIFPKEAESILAGDFSLSVFGVKGKSTLKWK